MRVAVEERGYAGAVDAFVGGNLLVARAGERLRGDLSACAGMAGDDSTATEFAASYDEAAASCVAALAELVGALGSLAHLTQASLANHRDAPMRCRVGTPSSGPPTRADHCVGLPSPRRRRRSAPPTRRRPALARLGARPRRRRLVAERRHRPGPGRGRDLADAPRPSVQLVTAHCGTALAALDVERLPRDPARRRRHPRPARPGRRPRRPARPPSPPPATTYADQVDAKRGDMLGLLHELAVELGVGALVAGGLSILSAGLAGPAAGAAGSARLAAAARELKGIVDALRLATGGTALEVRTVPRGGRRVGWLLLEAVAVRGWSDDGGAATDHATGRADRSRDSRRVSEPERAATRCEKHVGQVGRTTCVTRAATTSDRDCDASSFAERDEGRRGWSRSVAPSRKRSSEIDDVARVEGALAACGSTTALDEVDRHLGRPTGDVARGQRRARHPCQGLQRCHDGYWIKTAFPQP